ncbi:MAG TPA: hypothetical protein VMU92_04750 [Acidobacteriaceae bacterium]|nr:hypothetical protein [Acidobacteriaceae bacterium]
MSTARPCFLFILWLITAGALALGQGVPAAPAAKQSPNHVPKVSQAPDGPQSDPSADLPAVALNFEDPKPIPGVPAAGAFVQPILCSPDGIPFVEFLMPKDFGPQSVYSLNPKGGRVYSVKAVPGLYDVSFLRGFFVSDSVVGLLVRATKDKATAPNTVSIGPGFPPKHVYTGAHYDYLVEFDRDGSYKKTLELPEHYDFWKVAALPDDTFIALAYDRVNAVPLLLVLDSDGEIKHPIELPNAMVGNPTMAQGETDGMRTEMAAESSMSWWLFATARKDILLYQAHTNAPVLEVGAGGVVREVPLQAPKGYVLDGIISASDRWIMRYRREGLSDGIAIDSRPEAKNYVLYEVNPLDGSLEREIDAATGPFYSIACEGDGVMTAFRMDGKKMERETADLPH